MAPVESTTIRSAFRDFVGDATYRKFLHALHAAPPDLEGLRFWQEQLWDSFVTSDPSLPRRFDAVRGAFQVCEIHNRDLLQERVLAHSGSRQKSAVSRVPHLDFPYSDWGVLSHEVLPGTALKFVDILYCPECREKRAGWEKDGNRLPNVG
jgi:hypothetical protein